MRQPQYHGTDFLPKKKPRRASPGKGEDKTKAGGRRAARARNPLIVLGNFVFMLTAFCLAAAALALYSVKTLYERPGPSAQPGALLVPAGSGVSAIADLLRARGFVSNAQVFVYGAYLEDKAKALKAGEYIIPAGASMQEIADILVSGRSLLYTLTLPEGMTVAQIFAKLKDDTRLTGGLPETLPPEGSLLTNTLKFTRGTSRMDILRHLTAGQARLVQKIWAHRAADLPLKNAEQMVILASVVEKETGIAAERPQIAAVFYNRLKKGMRLQSDPTVLYGLFGSAGKPANRAIYRSDLEKDTPYNTYKIFGLPPAPICNPGRASLLAAANPRESEDLYFVADGSGGHLFAKTLAEHNINVSKWRALRKMREQAAAGADADGGADNAADGGAPAAEESSAPGAAEAAEQGGDKAPPPSGDAAAVKPEEKQGAAAGEKQQKAPQSHAPLMRQLMPLSQGNGALIEEKP